MCCNGTLFGRTGLKPDGPSPNWPNNIIRTICEGEMLPQPCAALQNGLCEIYPTRPKACKKFKCKLLKEFASGAINAEEAHKVIRNIKQLKSEFLDALSKVIPVSAESTPNVLYRQFEEVFKEDFDRPEFKRKHARLLLLFARFNHERNSRFYELDPDKKPVVAQSRQASNESGKSLIDLEIMMDEMPSEKAL